MPYFLVWVILAILVAIYADRKGRSGVGFFFLALLASPLIGFLAALAVEPKREKVAANAGMKKCPDCGEYVRGEARICRFCRHEFWTVPVEALPKNEAAEPQSSDFEAWSKEAVASDSVKERAPLGSYAAAISTTPRGRKIFLYLTAVAVIGLILWLSLSRGV